MVVPPQPTPPPRRWVRLGIQGTAAVLVSVLALWWAFHDADFEEMGERLRDSSPAVLLLYFVGQVVLHLLRVLRWGMYVRALDGKISGRAIFAAANLGIAGTFFLPLRLGEFIRPMMINRAGVRFGGAVASVVVERIADGLCALTLFFLSISFVPASAPFPEDLTRLSRAAAIGFGGGFLFLLAAAVAREPVLGLTRLVLRRVSATLADRVVGLIGTFLDGLAALGSAYRAAAYIGLTVVYWTGSGLLTWYLAVSYAPELPVVSGIFTIGVLVFAVMIPAGPAFAGTFEIGFKYGFGAFGLATATTGAIAVVAHVGQIAMMAGFIGAGLLVAEPRQRRTDKREPA